MASPTSVLQPPVLDRHVRRTGDDYAVALLSLLPQGQAWPRDPGSILAQTLTGLAQYWGFVDSRAADLLETESDPRITMELLRDWERAWGLPDPCITAPITLQDRRYALVKKMTLLGAQSRAFFYQVADELGYEITIREFSPFMTGVSHCGDTTNQPYNSEAPDNVHPRWQLGPPEIRFYWTVHVNALKLTYFRTGLSQTGVDRLLRIGVAIDLECVFDRWKPAHTDIVYDYSPFVSVDFTGPFNSQYLAMGIM